MRFDRFAAIIIAAILTVVLIKDFYGTEMWPKTNGRVMASFVKKHPFYYEPIIQYEYTVGGKTYRNSRMVAGFPGHHFEFNKRKAVAIVFDHDVNEAVQVFYDPQNPNKATLSLYFGRHAIEKYLGWFVCASIVFLGAFALNTGSSRVRS